MIYSILKRSKVRIDRVKCVIMIIIKRGRMRKLLAVGERIMGDNFSSSLSLKKSKMSQNHVGLIEKKYLDEVHYPDC